MFVAIEKSSVSNCLRIEVKKSGSLDDVMCELERSRWVWLRAMLVLGARPGSNFY
jgi:hypothetical protein